MLILNLCPWPIGGFATFLKHLYHSCIAANTEVTVLKYHKRTEHKQRVNKEGIMYRNVDGDELIKVVCDYPSRAVLVAPHPKGHEVLDELQPFLINNYGTRPIVHDPNDFKKFPHLTGINSEAIVIRPSMKKHHLSKATFIRHPYYAKEVRDVRKKKLACSLAMVTPLKNPKFIVQANEAIKQKRNRVVFVGCENRLFTRGFKVRWPTYTSSKGFPRGIFTAVDAAEPYVFNVDMSIFPRGDGGGTQYSFLEAMDAMTVNVLHHEWTDILGDMNPGVNCLSVHDQWEIATLMNSFRDNKKLQSKTKRIAKDARKYLTTYHDPKTIISKYRRALKQ